jgi:hypothetical protein
LRTENMRNGRVRTRVNVGALIGSPPSPDPPRPRARGAIPAFAPALRRITPPEAPGPSAAGRIARPSAGSGSHLGANAGPGCRGAFPPPGALGPIGRAGGPRQTSIRPLYGSINGLGGNLPLRP